MARDLRRLLVERPRLEGAEGRVALQGPELHYLRRVLRLGAEEAFGLVDGSGQFWTAVLELGSGWQQGWAVLQQSLEEPLVSVPAPQPSLQLAVALPRRDAEVMLRMACELGVDRFQWLQAERSVAEAAIRPERQQAVLREALEQCERLWLPHCLPAQPALAWLSAATSGVRLLATTRRPTALPLGEALEAHGPLASAAELAGAAEPVLVAIGPEGGWSPQEEGAALERGWQAVQLGEGILRTSTAAVAAASLLSSWRQQLGFSCGTSPTPSP